MVVRRLEECREFIAGDGSMLREFLHPDKGEFAFGYSLARAVVKPKQATKPHRLKSSEAYYIINGRGLMCVDGESRPVEADTAIYIPPGGLQYIANSGDIDLEFICIVEPAWRGNDEQVF